MKELRRNMRLVGTLVIVIFVGLAAWFALTVFEQGSIWASNSYNTRLTSARTKRGDILDRNGTVLAATVDGERRYLDDKSARRALVATVGDTAGMSGVAVESRYSSQLLDLSDSLIDRLNALFNGTERKGSTVCLTVDAALTEQIADLFPKGYRGAVCLLNYKTGEIVAMVSKPDYDPYDVSAAEDTAYLNRCLQGSYAPGSVFKIVTLASALEHDPSVTSQAFVCSGTWGYEGGSIVCAGKKSHGSLSLQQAFMKSCNVTFGKLAYQLGLERMLETAERFGFNENFKFGDFSVYNSRFPTSLSNTSDLVWAGIGQSTVLVTPLHMAMITASVANQGVMMTPWLVRSITDSNGTVTHTGAAQPYRTVMSPDNARTVAEYMYETVESGTATRAQVRGYTVCGKTGSAETSDDKSVATNSWYTGFVLDDAHPYAVSVVIEQGGAGAKLASELASKAIALAVRG